MLEWKRNSFSPCFRDLATKSSILSSESPGTLSDSACSGAGAVVVELVGTSWIPESVWGRMEVVSKVAILEKVGLCSGSVSQHCFINRYLKIGFRLIL